MGGAGWVAWARCGTARQPSLGPPAHPGWGPRLAPPVTGWRASRESGSSWGSVPAGVSGATSWRAGRPRRQAAALPPGEQGTPGRPCVFWQRKAMRCLHPEVACVRLGPGCVSWTQGPRAAPGSSTHQWAAGGGPSSGRPQSLGGPWEAEGGTWSPQSEAHPGPSRAGVPVERCPSRGAFSLLGSGLRGQEVVGTLRQGRTGPCEAAPAALAEQNHGHARPPS